MKIVVVVVFLLLMVSGPPLLAQSGGTDLRNPFVGAWRLASLEESDAEGHLRKADCTGLFVFSRDGHASVQVMYKQASTDASAAPVQYAKGGYEASFGRYEVTDAHTFTFHVDGALVRTLVGKDLERVYEFSGKQLIVKSPDPKEHWRVVWERE